jgi:excisionase family DNA binding protein
VTLAGAARILNVLGLKAAALLVRVAEGKLPAYHPATTPVRLGDLLFRRADVMACAATVKAENGWLDRVETARFLRVTEPTLKQLVERGLLTPLPVSSRAYFFDRATVEAFGRDHLNSTEAAALLGVGADVVMRWTRRGRLQAVSGPGVDDTHNYLFNRPDLVQRRADWLPFGEAAALLGVHKSTLHRWVMRGKIAPLAGMGGKQRWFSRQDILRLRENLSQGTNRPRAERRRLAPDRRWR